MLVTLARMIAHVGNFDNKRLMGGSFPSFAGESVFPAWISLSSDLLINWFSRGSFVTPFVHVVNQSSPRDEKRMKGPLIPIDDNIIGVNSKPATLPR